ncbi:MAG TPA: DUF177 domain-containing protein [Thermoleophilaceae bacterium]|nr:DUF177 domain-containing protein [Thermoleophilaceae bacterium]
MARHTDLFELGRLGLSSGESRRLDLDVVLDPVEFGGESYRSRTETAHAVLDVARTTTGYSLRLRYSVDLAGPCARCLAEAGQRVEVDAREVDQPGGGEELRSPYLEGDELDVRSWARDGLALALPEQIVCEEECRGLCSICGENLNRAGEDHRHERPPDPRWAKLAELELD